MDKIVTEAFERLEEYIMSPDTKVVFSRMRDLKLIKDTIPVPPGPPDFNIGGDNDRI